MDVMPPSDVRIGFGDCIARSLLGLITIGSGRLPAGLAVLPLRSNKSLSEVVGGMGDESTDLFPTSSAVSLLYSDSRLGFGGGAGLFVVFARGRAEVVPAPTVLGDLAVASCAAWFAGDFARPFWGCFGTARFGTGLDLCVGVPSMCVSTFLPPSSPVALPAVEATAPGDLDAACFGLGVFLKADVAATAPLVPLGLGGALCLGAGRPKAVVAPSKAALWDGIEFRLPKDDCRDGFPPVMGACTA